MDITESFTDQQLIIPDVTPPLEFINVNATHPGPSTAINQLIKQELTSDQSTTIKTTPEKSRKLKSPPKTSTERSRECRARKSPTKVVKKEKKRSKTTVERMREYRARQKLLRNQLKCFFYTSAPKAAPKTAAERSREYRARKNSAVQLKKVPKTPAQLSREYRQRRKLMKDQLIWNLKSEDELKQWLKQYQIDSSTNIMPSKKRAFMTEVEKEIARAHERERYSRKKAEKSEQQIAKERARAKVAMARRRAAESEQQKATERARARERLARRRAAYSEQQREAERARAREAMARRRAYESEQRKAAKRGRSKEQAAVLEQQRVRKRARAKERMARKRAAYTEREKMEERVKAREGMARKRAAASVMNINLPVPNGPLEEQEMNELVERLQQSQREEQETIKEESAEPSTHEQHTSTSESDTTDRASIIYTPDLKPELSTTQQHTSDTEPTHPEVKQEFGPTESVYIDESYKFESINLPPNPDNSELIVPKVETVEILAVKVEPEEIPEVPVEQSVEEGNSEVIVPKIELEEESVFDQIWNFPSLIALPSPSWACHRVITSTNQRFITFMNAKITETNFIAETERQIIIRDSLQTTFVYENRIIRNMEVFKFELASVDSIEAINKLLFEFAAFNQRLG